jgi:hypothetical protein
MDSESDCEDEFYIEEEDDNDTVSHISGYSADALTDLDAIYNVKKERVLSKYELLGKELNAIDRNTIVESVSHQVVLSDVYAESNFVTLKFLWFPDECIRQIYKLPKSEHSILVSVILSDIRPPDVQLSLDGVLSSKLSCIASMLQSHCNFLKTLLLYPLWPNSMATTQSDCKQILSIFNQLRFPGITGSLHEHCLANAMATKTFSQDSSQLEFCVSVLRQFYFGNKIPEANVQTMAAAAVDEKDVDAFYSKRRSVSTDSNGGQLAESSVVPQTIDTDIIFFVECSSFVEGLHEECAFPERLSLLPENKHLDKSLVNTQVFNLRMFDIPLYRKEWITVSTILKTILETSTRRNQSKTMSSLFLKLFCFAIVHCNLFCSSCGLPHDIYTKTRLELMTPCNNTICRLQFSRLNIDALVLWLGYDIDATVLKFYYALIYFKSVGQTARYDSLKNAISEYNTIEELILACGNSKMIPENHREEIASVATAFFMKRVNVHDMGPRYSNFSFVFEVETTNLISTRDFQAHLKKSSYVSAPNDVPCGYVDLAFHGSRRSSTFNILQRGLMTFSGTSRQAVGAAYGSGVYCGDYQTALSYTSIDFDGIEIQHYPKIISSNLVVRAIIGSQLASMFDVEVVTEGMTDRILQSSSSTHIPKNMVVVQSDVGTCPKNLRVARLCLTARK